MIQDPEHVRGDPEGDVSLVLDSGVARTAPGHQPHLVREELVPPHDGSAVVSRTGCLAERVRTPRTYVTVIDHVTSGVTDLAVLQGRASDGQLVQVDSFNQDRLYNQNNDNQLRKQRIHFRKIREHFRKCIAYRT